MAMTLGISFSPNRCDAVLLHENKGIFSCVTKKSFDAQFNNPDHAFRIQDELKPLCHKKTRVIVGIPHGQTMMQQLVVDKGLSEKETMAFLKTQITPLFGKNQQTVYWDYEINAVTHLHQEITLIAAPKTIIDAIQKIFFKINLSITAIEPDLFSLVRLITTYSREKIFYALIAIENGFLFLSGHNGKLKRYEKIASTDSHQLSLILSSIEPNNRIMLISMQNDLKAVLKEHNLVTNFVSNNELIQISNIENSEHYLSAIALCSWGI